MRIVFFHFCPAKGFVIFMPGPVPIHLLTTHISTLTGNFQSNFTAYLIYLRLGGNQPSLKGYNFILIHPCCTTPAIPLSLKKRSHSKLNLNICCLGHIKFSFKIISRLSDLLVLFTKTT